MINDDPTRTDLDDLEDRLRRARDEGKPVEPVAGDGEAGGFSMAVRVGSELVSALIVGVVVGLLLDNWLGTGPWFLVVFFFLGAGAGVLNVYRVASGMGSGVGYRRDDKPGSRQDDKMDKR